MCGDPVTIGLMAVSTAMSAVGAIRQGGAADAAAKAEAQAAEQQAQGARNRAQFEIAQERRAQRQAFGQQVAQLGSQGTALTGQPIDLLADNAKQAELALQAIRFESEIAALNQENQAALTRFGGRGARREGFFSAGTELLRGATSIAGELGKPSPPENFGRVKTGRIPIPTRRPEGLGEATSPSRSRFRSGGPLR